MKAWAFILRDRKVNRDIAKSDSMETIIKKAKKYSFDKCGNPLQDREPFIMMLSADGHHYSEIDVFTGKEY